MSEDRERRAYHRHKKRQKIKRLMDIENHTSSKGEGYGK